MNAVKKPLLREVTLGKLKRDAENIQQHARFVVVLNGHQPEIIDNGHLRKNGLPYAKLIAVVGPVHYKGASLGKSVLMEVGYSRTRPYAQLEERPGVGNGGRPGHRWFLKQRLCVRKPTHEELVLTYPLITQCMASIVLESREHWSIKTKGTWFVPGAGEIERGIHFTVSHSDELLHRQFIREDVKYREKRYIADHARWIGSLLRKYARSHYSAKQLRSFGKARVIAEVLAQEHYTPFYRAVLSRNFAEGSHERMLFDSIIEAFKIDVSLNELEAYALESVPIALPRLKNLQCYHSPKQRALHARNASVFELMLERSYREQNETPF